MAPNYLWHKDLTFWARGTEGVLDLSQPPLDLFPHDFAAQSPSSVHITSQTCPVLSYLHGEGTANVVEIHRPRSESELCCFQSSVSASNLQISESLHLHP